MYYNLEYILLSGQIKQVLQIDRCWRRARRLFWLDGLFFVFFIVEMNQSILKTVS
jgi:type II secretory pathway component PulL